MAIVLIYIMISTVMLAVVETCACHVRIPKEVGLWWTGVLPVLQFITLLTLSVSRIDAGLKCTCTEGQFVVLVGIGVVCCWGQRAIGHCWKPLVFFTPIIWFSEIWSMQMYDDNDCWTIFLANAQAAWQRFNHADNHVSILILDYHSTSTCQKITQHCQRRMDRGQSGKVNWYRGISKNTFFLPLYKKVQWLTIVECHFLLSSAFSFQNYYNTFTFAS